MKTILLSLIFVCFCGFSVAGQSAREIASIRTEVNLINKSAPKYQKKTRDVEGISLEGAEATYFTSGKGLKKITARMYGETFRAMAELYYSGEEMIFAYQRLERYSGHIAMKPAPKVAQVIETRVYYAGSKAIRVLEDKKQLSPDSAEFRGADEGMTDLSQKLRAAIQQ